MKRDDKISYLEILVISFTLIIAILVFVKQDIPVENIPPPPSTTLRPDITIPGCRPECCALLTLKDPSGEVRLEDAIMNCTLNCTECSYDYPCDEHGRWNGSINYTYIFGDIPSEINNYTYLC